MRTDNLVAGLLVLSLVGCAGARGRGPAIGSSSSSKVADVGGTISGVVRASEGSVPLVGRLVTAIEVTTGAKYESQTASNGGYTMKVPKGRYRLELQLKAGESLAKQPEETEIDTSDMDAGRDFLVASKPPPA